MKQSSALVGVCSGGCVVVTIMGNNYIYVLVNVGCVTRHGDIHAFVFADRYRVFLNVLLWV